MPTVKRLSPDFVENLVPEAQKTLHGLQQEVALSDLGQMYRTRTIEGVEIKTKSILGQDFIEINTDMETAAQRQTRLSQQGIIDPPLPPHPIDWKPPIPIDPPDPWPIPWPDPWPGPWPWPGDRDHGCDCSKATIGYTTLQMSINEEQTLTALGGGEGCEYTWESFAGGGSLTGEGSSVIFTAPASNENCSNNPVINLYCNGVWVDQISMAINAYDGFYKDTPAAYDLCTECEEGAWYDGKYNWNLYGDIHYCDGRALYRQTFCACWSNLPDGCMDEFCDWCGAHGPYPCGLTDTRNAEMIAGGCCPEALL